MRDTCTLLELCFVASPLQNPNILSWLLQHCNLEFSTRFIYVVIDMVQAYVILALSFQISKGYCSRFPSRIALSSPRVF